MESYEVVYGYTEDYKHGSSILQAQRMPQGLVDSLKISEHGVKTYRIHHTLGILILSPSEYAATTTTAESAYNRPDCPLFVKVDELLPTLHSQIDIMGVSHLEKVAKAARGLIPTTVTCLSATYLQNEENMVDDRLGEKYGACKDGVTIVHEAAISVHDPFKGFSEGFCILIQDMLLVYDLASDYYNKMMPMYSICISNCVLSLSGKSKSGRQLLSVATAISTLVLSLTDLHITKEFVQYLGDAVCGSSNIKTFIDGVINPELTAQDRDEYLATKPQEYSVMELV